MGSAGSSQSRKQRGSGRLQPLPERGQGVGPAADCVQRVHFTGPVGDEVAPARPWLGTLGACNVGQCAREQQPCTTTTGPGSPACILAINSEALSTESRVLARVASRNALVAATVQRLSSIVKRVWYVAQSGRRFAGLAHWVHGGQHAITSQLTSKSLGGPPARARGGDCALTRWH